MTMTTGRPHRRAVLACLLTLLPAPSWAAFECFGPYTLTVTARTTPINTVSPVATPTVFSTPGPISSADRGGTKAVHLYSNHLIYGGFTDDGDLDGASALYAKPYLKFTGIGPDSQTIPLLNIGTGTNTPSGLVPSAVADAGAYTDYKITDVAVKAIKVELVGCINCTAVVGWCSRD